MIEEKEAQEREKAEKQVQQAQKKAKKSHSAYAPTEDMEKCSFESTLFNFPVVEEES